MTDILLCFLYLAFTGILGFFLGRLLPKHWFDEKNPLFQSRSFEQNGKIYEKLGVRSWQNRVPDMSRILPGLLPPKRYAGCTPEALPRMITETCIAEFIHLLLAFTGLGCLLIHQGAAGVIITLLYELGNLPYILIQRYNRPRLVRIRDKYRTRTLKHPLDISEGEPIHANHPNLNIEQ